MLGISHNKVSHVIVTMLGISVLGGTVISARANVIDRPFFRAHALAIVFGGNDFIENGGRAPIVFDFTLLDATASGASALDLIGVDGVAVNNPGGGVGLLPVSSGEDQGAELVITDPVSGGVFTSAAPHQTLDGNDAFSAFEIDENTDIDRLGGGNQRSSRFFVASNAPFDIFAESRETDLVATGDFSSFDLNNIRFRFRVQRNGGSGTSAWGSAAQNPTGSGGRTTNLQAPGTTLDTFSSGPVRVFDGVVRTAARPGTIMEQAVSFQARYNLRGGAQNTEYDFSLGTGSLGATVTYTIYTP